MKSFLKSSDKHTYIFDLKNSIKEQITLNAGLVKVIDENTIEIEVESGIVLNDIFAELTSKYKLEVLDVRTKAAKLEKLFIDIAKNK
jgi:ABC-2 type transport system ATP-binding protein